MTRKQQRLGLLALGMAALGGATLLVLSAFNDNLVFFYSPSELRAKAVAADRSGLLSLLGQTATCRTAPASSAPRALADAVLPSP